MLQYVYPTKKIVQTIFKVGVLVRSQTRIGRRIGLFSCESATPQALSAGDELVIVQWQPLIKAFHNICSVVILLYKSRTAALPANQGQSRTFSSATLCTCRIRGVGQSSGRGGDKKGENRPFPRKHVERQAVNIQCGLVNAVSVRRRTEQNRVELEWWSTGSATEQERPGVQEWAAGLRPRHTSLCALRSRIYRARSRTESVQRLVYLFVCLSQCCCCCCCSLCLIAASVDDLFRLVCYPTVSLLSRSVSRLGLGHSRSLCVEWIAACSFCAGVIASLCL